MLVLLELTVAYSNKCLIGSGIFVVCSLMLCTASHGKVVLYTILSIVAIIIRSVYIFQWDMFHIFILIHQISFVILYFILRYCFDPQYDFFVFIANILKRVGNYLFLHFIGRNTYEYLFNQNEKNKLR